MLFLIVIILFPFVIWQTMKRQKMAVASAAWPTVPGVVTSSAAAKVAFRTQPRITYTYEKDGRNYSGSTISFANVVPRADVEAILNRYPVGQAVTVRYSPQDPAIAALEPGHSKQLTSAIRSYCYVMVILIVVQCLNIALRLWVPSGDQTKSRTYDDAGSQPTVDPQVVDKNIRDAAEKGQATEQFTLGMWYLTGKEGPSKDPAEAAKWFTKSADQGEPHAQVMLGNLYVKGMGVEKDEVKGVALYQKAAAQGLPLGFAGIGYAYEKGIGGMPKDANQAAEWYKKAGDIQPAKEGLERLNKSH